jgi:hypothetical protein
MGGEVRYMENPNTRCERATLWEIVIISERDFQPKFVYEMAFACVQHLAFKLQKRCVRCFVHGLSPKN